MTTVTTTWPDLSPVRGALARVDVSDTGVWADRLRSDLERAARHQTAKLAAITAAVEERSRELGALALILSGSTARGRRTRVSDLDYHVIGRPPETKDLPEDIDLYSDDSKSFMDKLRSGDDFAHWSVWYGCVLFDSGVVRRGVEYAALTNAWPDPDRKLGQAQHALDFAGRMVESGDHERALDEVRGALSLTARWCLLSHDVFPLSRDELAGQLIDTGQDELAAALQTSIHERPDLASLARAIASARQLTVREQALAR